MTDYKKLIKELRETAKHLDGISRFPYDDDPAKRIYSKKMADAADAIEALQAEYEREKRRADMYAELFDIMRKSRNEIIEQIGRVKGVPDFALYYPEYNLCANYPKKKDSSESPNS